MPSKRTETIVKDKPGAPISNEPGGIQNTGAISTPISPSQSLQQPTNIDKEQLKKEVLIEIERDDLKKEIVKEIQEENSKHSFSKIIQSGLFLLVLGFVLTGVLG